MPIADVIAIAGSARCTAGWRMNWLTGAKRPPRTGAGRRFADPSSTGVRICASAMDYTGMFMMSRYADSSLLRTCSVVSKPSEAFWRSIITLTMSCVSPRS